MNTNEEVAKVLRRAHLRMMLRSVVAWLGQGFFCGIGLMVALYALSFLEGM